MGGNCSVFPISHYSCPLTVVPAATGAEYQMRRQQMRTRRNGGIRINQPRRLKSWTGRICWQGNNNSTRNNCRLLLLINIYLLFNILFFGVFRSRRGSSLCEAAASAPRENSTSGRPPRMRGHTRERGKLSGAYDLINARIPHKTRTRSKGWSIHIITSLNIYISALLFMAWWLRCGSRCGRAPSRVNHSTTLSKRGPRRFPENAINPAVVPCDKPFRPLRDLKLNSKLKTFPLFSTITLPGERERGKLSVIK